MNATMSMSTDQAITTLIAMFASYAIVMGIILVVEIIGMWKVFTKAGEAGWKCLIPIYNVYCLYRIAGKSMLGIASIVLGLLGGILSSVIAGVVGMVIAACCSIACLVLYILLCTNLSRSYGHGGGFAVGLFFLQTIFLLILGFGSSQYVGTKQ